MMGVGRWRWEKAFTGGGGVIIMGGEEASSPLLLFSSFALTTTAVTCGVGVAVGVVVSFLLQQNAHSQHAPQAIMVTSQTPTATGATTGGIWASSTSRPMSASSSGSGTTLRSGAVLPLPFSRARVSTRRVSVLLAAGAVARTRVRWISWNRRIS